MPAEPAPVPATGRGRLAGVAPRDRRHARRRPASELADLGTRPVAYVSLGTVPLFNHLATFELLLGALATEPLDVVVTVVADGLPLVLVPQGAEQFDNATACSHAGVALVLASGTYDGAPLRDAVDTVLADESPQRTAASRLATEIATMPGATQAVIAIEALAANVS